MHAPVPRSACSLEFAPVPSGGSWWSEGTGREKDREKGACLWSPDTEGPRQLLKGSSIPGLTLVSACLSKRGVEVVKEEEEKEEGRMASLPAGGSWGSDRKRAGERSLKEVRILNHPVTQRADL